MHYKLDILAEKGYVVLNDYDGPTIPRKEWESLEYMDWKSGGDTNFAPLASATGEMDCRGFWDHGKADKYGIWTSNHQIAPSLVQYVEKIGGNYGRVRVIKLNPSDEAAALRQLHLDDNNRLNSEGTGWVVRSWLELDNAAGQSMFILREDKADPSTETRITLHPGMQIVIDTERLWHVVWHPGPLPRYALITSWESDKTIGRWIKRQTAKKRQLTGARSLASSGAARPGASFLTGRAVLALVTRGFGLFGLVSPQCIAGPGPAERDPATGLTRTVLVERVPSVISSDTSTLFLIRTVPVSASNDLDHARLQPAHRIVATACRGLNRAA